MKRAVLGLLAGVLAGCPVLSERDEEERLDADDDDYLSEAYGGLDCNDLDAAVKPGAPEVCDGVDNDCDLLVNEEDPDAVDVDWYLDGDGDGFGDPLVHVRTCARLGGSGERHPWVRNADDCDDQDAEQRPGQTWLLDGDGDGYGTTGRHLEQCGRPPAFVAAPKGVALADCGVLCDCDDTNREVRPGAAERCNGVDDDCDAQDDEHDADLGVARWYVDHDGDGYGDPASEPAICDEEGRAPNGADCDDHARRVNPGVPEVPYAGGDENCNPADDYDYDRDGESYPDDCNDGAAWIHTGAPELCSGLSEACDPAWTPASDLGKATFYPAFDSFPPELGYAEGDLEYQPDGGVDIGIDLAFQPIDVTAELTTGQQAVFASAGSLFLCGDDTTDPFWGGIQSGYGVISVAGVRVGADANGDGVRDLVPSAVTLDARGDPLGVDLSYGGAIADVTLRGSDRPNQGCLTSYSDTALQNVVLDGCSAGVLGGAATLYGAIHTLVDVSVVDARGAGVLVSGGDLLAVGLVVTGTDGAAAVRRTQGPGTLSFVGGDLSANKNGGILAPRAGVVLEGTVLDDDGPFAVRAGEVSLVGGARASASDVGVDADAIVCDGAGIHGNDLGLDAADSVDATVACDLGADGDVTDNVVDLRVGAFELADASPPLSCTSAGSSCP